MYGWIFGQGFNSPRLHHSLSRKVIYNKKSSAQKFSERSFFFNSYEAMYNEEGDYINEYRF